MGLIRFLLACIVVICHTSPLFGYQSIPSDLAVQFFYVLSGFYMTLVLNEKYHKGSNTSFYKNRALKIYPVYWLILILLIAWGIFVYLLGYPGTLWFYEYASPLDFSTWLYLIIANVFIIGLDFTFLLGIENGKLFFTGNYQRSEPNVYQFGFNSIAWTVGLELVFYLIAPFILRKRIMIPIFLLISSLFLRIYLSINDMSGHPWDYMFFPTQLMFFMAGCISYHLYSRIKNNPPKSFFLRCNFCLMLIALMLYSYLFANTYVKQAIFFPLITLLIPGTFILTKNSKIDRYLGNLSYPIYISQMLIISITRANSFPKIFGQGFTTLMIVLLFSVLLERYFSRRIETLKVNPIKIKKKNLSAVHF